MLADLDESLRALLKRELQPHGFGGVNVPFEAPARSWSSTLSTPTVNLFLYDLREAAKRRPATGGFAFESLAEGEHGCPIRTTDGRQVEARLRVPGAALELRLPGHAAAANHGRVAGPPGWCIA